MANANSQYFFHRQNWSIDTNPPGYPISILSALAISAVMGLLFVVFLPIIGFVLAGKALLQKIGEVVRPALHTAVMPQSVPGEAHLTGSPGTGKGERSDAEVDQILKEIQERRHQK